VEQVNDAYVAGMSMTELRGASVSPLHEDMGGLASPRISQLPPALSCAGQRMRD
jgi:hypothetical protein